MASSSDPTHAPSPSTPDTSAASTPGMFEQFQIYSAKAQSLVADDEVRPLKLEAELVVFNLKKGVTVITPYRAQLATDMPAVSFEDIGSLTGMCQALLYADAHAQRLAPTPPSTDANAAFSQGHKLRRVLLNKAIVAVDDGLLAESVVEAIRRGTGPLDMGNDCIELARIFFENPAMAARVNVSSTDIQTANDIGAKVIDIVKPRRAVASAGAADTEQREAAAARDRIWTLVERTWERNVWRAGACVFGRDVEKHIPLLGSGVRTRKTAEPTPPAPEPAPTPAVVTGFRT